MRLELHDVAIGDGPGAALPRLGAVADRWVPGFVAVETEIAGMVARALANRLGVGSGFPVRVAASGDTNAYDAFLRGRDLYGQIADLAAAKLALAQFDAAIAAWALEMGWQ